MDWYDAYLSGNITDPSPYAETILSRNLSPTDERRAMNRYLSSKEQVLTGNVAYRSPSAYCPSCGVDRPTYTAAEAARAERGCAFPAYRDQIRQQIADLQNFKDQFPGPEGTFIRWLIRQKQTELHNQLETEFHGLFDAGDPLFLREYEPPPIPDWLAPYVEPSMPYQKSQYPYTDEPVEDKMPWKRRGRDGEAVETPSLRPLGAQAELTPEQLGLMAGYQAWGRAGSPMRYSGGAIRDMADWQRWWDQYVALSKSLFPKSQKKTAGWQTARQR